MKKFSVLLFIMCVVFLFIGLAYAENSKMIRVQDVQTIAPLPMIVAINAEAATNNLNTPNGVMAATNITSTLAIVPLPIPADLVQITEVVETTFQPNIGFIPADGFGPKISLFSAYYSAHYFP